MPGETAQRLGDVAGDGRLFSNDQSFAHMLNSRFFQRASDLLFCYRLLAKLLKLQGKSKYNLWALLPKVGVFCLKQALCELCTASQGAPICAAPTKTAPSSISRLAACTSPKKRAVDLSRTVPSALRLATSSPPISASMRWMASDQ